MYFKLLYVWRLSVFYLSDLLHTFPFQPTPNVSIPLLDLGSFIYDELYLYPGSHLCRFLYTEVYIISIALKLRAMHMSFAHAHKLSSMRAVSLQSSVTV
ncbi:hypothetical protein FKM82_007437 [Ascaphus truei]